MQLTLTQPDTGLTRTAVTGTDGRFVFAGLPAGAYELRAELSGFGTQVRHGHCRHRRRDRVAVALTMEVGGVEQAVTVHADGVAGQHRRPRS